MNASNASAAVRTRHQRTRPRWRVNGEGGAGGCCWKFWGDGLENFGVRKVIITYNFWMRNYGMSNDFLGLFAVFLMLGRLNARWTDALIVLCESEGDTHAFKKEGSTWIILNHTLYIEYAALFLIFFHVGWDTCYVRLFYSWSIELWLDDNISHQHTGFLPTSLITGSGKPSSPRVFIATAAGTRRTNRGRRNASDKCAKCRFGKWVFGRSVNMQYVGHDAGPGSFYTWNGNG